MNYGTCFYCGKVGLIWFRKKDGTWVLTENGTNKHVCPKAKKVKKKKR